ncbi:PP2C family protein-serine/threonine phosphatase [Nocardioides sp.]|uniref:PP2C family protein-serine/threonine phosphatase n=1 Tax=Nocardioides sp. TaxID=35761 RepID=UPI002B26D1A9|nr:PP2C family protein-serine/threonine phosphatase [Nocardioides sp.]
MTTAVPGRARLDAAELRLAAAMGAFAALVAAMVIVFPTVTPFSTLLIPIVVGSLLLGPRALPPFVLFVLAMLAVSLFNQTELTSRTLGAAAVQVVIGLIVIAASRRRSRLGVAGLRGESMFVDLRDRILNQGAIPDLPSGWVVESALHSAGGTAFAGDFIVATRSADGALIQLVVVDVSGKGEEAGPRALLLSGAFGGLLGALPPEGFLPAANDYVLRQDWPEGFASAIHLCVDLRTGNYEVRSAGHPPAAHRASGTGRWSVLRTEGPVLGLMPEARFNCVRGHLDSGDAVLLYTDGMVEDPHRDIDLGIDRMLGAAESMLRGSFIGAAERLATSLGSPGDDRAMMVVHRR